MHLAAAEPDPVAPYPPQPPRLLDRVRDRLRIKHYSIAPSNATSIGCGAICAFMVYGTRPKSAPRRSSNSSPTRTAVNCMASLQGTETNRHAEPSAHPAQNCPATFDDSRASRN